MSPYKAPGSDGLRAIFYLKNWDLVGRQVTEFFLNAFREGKFDEKFSETLISIVPTVDNPETISQFRPVSLCNVVVKLITKFMVSRIKPILQALIPLTQCSFLPNRGCTDNILVVQEAIHSMKKSKGKKCHFMMKLDLEKAYDRVNWDFLRWVLLDMGLPVIGYHLSCGV